MLDIIIYLLIFYSGVAVGWFLFRFISKVKDYDGVIVITEGEDKLLYSLELYDDVAGIEDKSELIFKIKPPEEWTGDRD
jgi:hypothetical protein